MIRYDTLLQNMTDVITKWDNCFITKCDKRLFFATNATVLLHNATVITNDRNVIAKGHIYYKIRRLLQTATVQTVWVIPST